MLFEWDPWKARTNFLKHGVRFPEAEPVFRDDYAITITDEESDPDEVRFVSIGADALNRILAVVYCYRDNTRRGTAIRIISARLADPNERKLYEDNR